MPVPEVQAWPPLAGWEPGPGRVLAAGGDGRTALFAVVDTAPAAAGPGLLDRLAANGAAAGARVLRASASALETDFQLGIVRQLFELPLMTAPARDQHAWLRGPAALAPRILGLGSEHAGAVAQGHCAAHAVFWLAANMSARRPLLIAISDLQWADPASLRWLAHLARRMSVLPIIVAAGIDTTQPHGDPAMLTALLAEVTRMPGPGLPAAAPDNPAASGNPAPAPQPGRRHRRPGPRPLALTPHEQRLITMAVSGLTNGEIAQQFGVTRRAVEFHFTQIYRKLGIDRRPQLYRYATAPAPAP
jgi:DNA-binding CsgD family transcriptional regulator